MMERSRKLKEQEKLMLAAENYEQWRERSLIYDELTGATPWKNDDNIQVRQRIDRLRTCRANGDNTGLVFALEEEVTGNIGNMVNVPLYERAKVATKKQIGVYVDEICSSLEHIADPSCDDISFHEKIEFFRRFCHCYGVPALMLGGGSSLGHFHIGVSKALLELKLLPDTISGEGVGSFVTAILGTHTDSELQTCFSEASKITTWFNSMFYGLQPRVESHDAEEIVNQFVPDLTFEEAFEKFGRLINISIALAGENQTSCLLNAITAPRVYIRKAVMASCAVPGVFPSVMLEAKNQHGERMPNLKSCSWVDGSLNDDVTIKRLARTYGITYCIASHIDPVSLFRTGNFKKRGRLVNFCHWLSFLTISKSTQLIYSVSKRYAQKWPRFNLFAKTIYSKLNQNYDANINISPDFRNIKLSKIISHLAEEELVTLVHQGECATWQKVDMIKTLSKISRIVLLILVDFDKIEEKQSAGLKGQDGVTPFKTALMSTHLKLRI